MFGKFGATELIIILVIVLLVFGGRGKISSIMGDLGSGLKAFKKSVKDDEEESVDGSSATVVEKTSSENNENAK